MINKNFNFVISLETLGSVPEEEHNFEFQNVTHVHVDTV